MAITAMSGRLLVDSDREPGVRWSSFVVLGILVLIAGLIAFANLLVATVASVFYVGVMMLIAGIAELIHAFQLRRWGRGFLYWLLVGLVYAIAGILAFVNPLLAAGALTLALAIGLMLAGVLRLFVGMRMRGLHGWGWIVASGVLTVLVGLLIVFGWPANALWILGLFLAIDLTFTGVALLSLGLALRADRGSPEVP